ncbi:MAG: hypothetical protein AB7I37_19570 [Pirellulales bacterium]
MKNLSLRKPGKIVKTVYFGGSTIEPTTISCPCKVYSTQDGLVVVRDDSATIKVHGVYPRKCQTLGFIQGIGSIADVMSSSTRARPMRLALAEWPESMDSLALRQDAEVAMNAELGRIEHGKRSTRF